MARNKIEVDLDITSYGPTITKYFPCEELKTKKYSCQQGFLHDTHSGLKAEYWLERIPGTETTADMMNEHGGFSAVDCAMFEVYLKNDKGQWELEQQGLLPVDLNFKTYMYF